MLYLRIHFTILNHVFSIFLNQLIKVSWSIDELISPDGPKCHVGWFCLWRINIIQYWMSLSPTVNAGGSRGSWWLFCLRSVSRIKNSPFVHDFVFDAVLDYPLLDTKLGVVEPAVKPGVRDTQQASQTDATPRSEFVLDENQEFALLRRRTDCVNMTPTRTQVWST